MSKWKLTGLNVTRREKQTYASWKRNANKWREILEEHIQNDSWWSGYLSFHSFLNDCLSLVRSSAVAVCGLLHVSRLFRPYINTRLRKWRCKVSSFGHVIGFLLNFCHERGLWRRRDAWKLERMGLWKCARSLHGCWENDYTRRSWSWTYAWTCSSVKGSFLSCGHSQRWVLVYLDVVIWFVTTYIHSSTARWRSSHEGQASCTFSYSSSAFHPLLHMGFSASVRSIFVTFTLLVIMNGDLYQEWRSWKRETWESLKKTKHHHRVEGEG